MKKILKAFLTLTVIITVLISVFSVYRFARIKRVESERYPLPDDYETLVMQPVCIDYAFDVNDKRKYTGFCDYVFVAYVAVETYTTYKNASYSSFWKLSATPYTHYNIIVLQNIKGEITTQEAVTLTVCGGVQVGGKEMCLIEASQLPKEGNVYVFFATADENGELLVESVGINDLSCKLSGKGAINSITAEYETLKKKPPLADAVQKYIEYYENEDTSCRLGERYVCKYAK